MLLTLNMVALYMKLVTTGFPQTFQEVVLILFFFSSDEEDEEEDVR